MPFQRPDVEKHIKGLTDQQKAAWVRVANETLKRCTDSGTQMATCEGRAIRVASTVARKIGESYELWNDDELVAKLIESELKKVGNDPDEGDGHMADIYESWAKGEALTEAQVDRTGGVLRNVKLCGKLSKNKRTYSDKALEDAARLYNHAPVYFDHPTDRELRERRGLRSVLDLAGTILNPRKVGDAVRGDVQLLESDDALSRRIYAIAEKAPHLAGMSHRAKGTVRRVEGGEVVEGLDLVHAVELVTDPATAVSLFESITEEETTDMKDLTYNKVKSERPDIIRQAIAEAGKQDEAEELKKENDKLKAQIALKERQELIGTKLAEAKLPAPAVTDTFKVQLQEAKDEAAIDALIEDRKALVKASKGGPVSTEREHDNKTDDKKLDEARALEVAGSVEDQLFG